MKISEDELELAVLEILKEIGYEIILKTKENQYDIENERESFEEIFLMDRFIRSIFKINPNLPKDIIDEAISQVKVINSPNLFLNNKEFHKLIIEGITVNYFKDNEEKCDIIKLIDFDNYEMNDFLAINQFIVIEKMGGNIYNRRPDIVLFINGIPIVVIELKNPADEKTTIKQAFKQILTYRKQITSLFRTNELIIISDGYEAKAGSLSANWERFTPWRTIESETQRNVSILQIEELLRGIIEPEKLLDYIRFFITFEDDGKGNIIKKSAAYHQFYAVNRAVKETIRATKDNGNQKIGVVWHTQGSGKSITMMFYTAKLIQELKNPTIVVITDRNDLDDQLFNTFVLSRDLLRQTPIQATARCFNPNRQSETKDNIQDLLKTSGGGIIFTTIQKFLPENDEEYPQLSDRKNIIVIADEAHRSHYSFEKSLTKKGKLVEGFANHLRKALPNASFVGFTATPVELVDRNTINVFGNYISIYDISQAIEDKTTVPIYYESRLAKIKLNKKFEGKIDPEFDEITEEEEDYAKEKLKSKWSKLEQLVSDPERLEEVAEDIVKHFEYRLDVIDGKGMIIGMSRKICCKLYNEIIKIRPDWHSDEDAKGFLKVVISGSASDVQQMQPHIRTKARRKVVETRIKDSSDDLKLVIVRDMWLTGFDVPSLHTMYVDKPMQGHNLMQAIARVNRVYKDKPGGLIVDYIGIGYFLKQALSKYSNQKSRDQTGIPQEEVINLMKTYFEIVSDMFYDFDYSIFVTGKPLQRLQLLPKAMEHILNLSNETPETAKKRFLDNLAALNKAFSLAVPHEDALAIRDDLAFFQAIRAGFVKATTPIKERKEQIDYAIKQLVSRAVISDDVIDIFASLGIEKPELSILSEEFLEEIKGLEYKNLAIEVLNKLLSDQIRARIKKNLVQSRSFEELLKKSINKYINRTIESAAILEELINLARKMQESYQKGEEMGLSDEEVAFYDALATNKSAVEIMGDETLKQIAKELVSAIRKSATIDFTVRKSVQAKMKVTIRKLLRRYKYPPDQTPQAIKLIMEQAQLFGEEWAAA